MGAQIGTMSRSCYFWNRHRCKRRVYVSRSTVRGHCCNEECSLLIFIVVDRSTMPCKQYTVRFAHTGISTNTKIPHDLHDLQIHGKLPMDCEPSCHSRFLVHGAAHDVRRKIKTLGTVDAVVYSGRVTQWPKLNCTLEIGCQTLSKLNRF